MSLYYDAASILLNPEHGGSLKSRVYSTDVKLKSKPAQVYALIVETAKYDEFIKEVVDNAGLLTLEPKLNPLLASLLIHDHIFSRGIAAPLGHPLRQSVERHKARIQAEATRARLKRKCASVEELKRSLAAAKGSRSMKAQPRWTRVNTLKTSVNQVLDTVLRGYRRVSTLAEVTDPLNNQKVVYLDHNIPNLLAISPGADLSKSQAYSQGEIILQDKASCFPAELLLGNNALNSVGSIIDGCAAPGNKTTHLASILATLEPTSNGQKRQIYACERDASRSEILRKMVAKAGCDEAITVLARQDFLTLDPRDARFADVTHILLDPSCSGSGILGREDIPTLVLPQDPKANKTTTVNGQEKQSLKRKRNDMKEDQSDIGIIVDEDGEVEEVKEDVTDTSRLLKLSNLQLMIIEHALAFPAATRVTYSTCSVHAEENELVVARALSSSNAQQRGWRLLRREEQVEGLRTWELQGLDTGSVASKIENSHVYRNLTDAESEACLRCKPGDANGTMGFFACAFTRAQENQPSAPTNGLVQQAEEVWQGFSDPE